MNRWYPPEMEWIKLNSNGACTKGGKDIACGGVLWDNSSNWIQGFYSYISRGGVLSIELRGALHGLSIGIWALGRFGVYTQMYSFSSELQPSRSTYKAIVKRMASEVLSHTQRE